MPELVPQDACRGTETLSAMMHVGRRHLQLMGRLPSSDAHPPHAIAVEGQHAAVQATQHRAAERFTLQLPSRRPLMLLAGHGPHALHALGDALRVGGCEAASTWYLDHHGDDVYTLWQEACAVDGTPARCGVGC